MAVRWGEITIGEIVAAVRGSQISGSPDRAAKGLCTDSRSMVPGHLFLALKGARYDGHDFLGDAVNAGAGGLILEAGRPLREATADHDIEVITVSSTLQALGDLASWWRKRWGGTVVACLQRPDGPVHGRESAEHVCLSQGQGFEDPRQFQ